MFRWSLSFLAVALLAIFPSLVCAEESDFSVSPHVRSNLPVHFQSVFLNCDADSVIVLSDGSQWIVRNHQAHEVFSDISARWQMGDEVRISQRTPEQYRGDFILKNICNGVPYLVDLDHSAFIDHAAPYLIDKMDENGYAIMTQDGSMWVFGWLGACTVQYWRKEDLLIINKGKYAASEDYLMINATNGQTSSASLISWR